MSLNPIYTCDICRQKKQDLDKLFGVYIDCNNIFKLTSYKCTEDTHICYDCAKKLKKQLERDEICGELEK